MCHRRHSDYWLLATLAAVLVAYLLLLWAMREATRSPPGTTHVGSAHFITFLMQTLALLAFLVLPTIKSHNDLNEREEQENRRSFGLLLVGLQGMGGFLLAVFFGFWDWFDPRLTALAQQQQFNTTRPGATTLPPPAVVSSTPGLLYLVGSAVMLLALGLRWVHHMARQDEYEQLQKQQDGEA